jgi:uncharacterized protein
VTEATRAAAGVLAPIDPRHRMEALDMVRGFALFGVLLVNMYNFGAYSPIWTDTSDRVALGLTRFFFETKSWRLFSLLFGLGFSLQLLRAQARGSRFAPVYLRRLAVLFLIGMGHALLFPGDVLMVYAELGLLLMLFRNAPPRLLLALAVALLALFPLGRAANIVVYGDGSAAARAVDLERARALNEELRTTHPHAVGSIGEVLEANATVIPPNPFGEPLGLESGLGFLAMFLLGLYLGRRRIFSDVDENAGLFRRGALVGLALGMLGMVVERFISRSLGSALSGGSWAAAGLALLGDLAFTYGSTALCLGYAATIALLSRDPRARRLVEPLGPVGRLALTVYLTQTLAFTTLFYGYGFGQAFRMGPAGVTATALLIFALQVPACGWWVRRYRYGPAEWLWRALTYVRLPPMRVPPERA